MYCSFWYTFYVFTGAFIGLSIPIPACSSYVCWSDQPYYSGSCIVWGRCFPAPGTRTYITDQKHQDYDKYDPGEASAGTLRRSASSISLITAHNVMVSDHIFNKIIVIVVSRILVLSSPWWTIITAMINNHTFSRPSLGFLRMKWWSLPDLFHINPTAQDTDLPPAFPRIPDTGSVPYPL